MSDTPAAQPRPASPNPTPSDSVFDVAHTVARTNPTGAILVSVVMAIFGGGGALSFTSLRADLATAASKLEEIGKVVAKLEARNDVAAELAGSAAKRVEDHEVRLRDLEKRLAVVEARGK